ncbi:MAG: HAMP domain-containing histidine kinase [Erysipelotrichaceae bacterium]|jgi:two-component system sensor histidine kinase CssS|nr:HAMP domain-containing histidine kinase [Erysipelotrichaceae bacterium]
MRKISNWIRHLSLTQQMIFVITFFLVTMVSFFYLYFTRFVDDFMNNQLQDVISASQTPIIETYLSQEHPVDFLKNYSDPNTPQAIFTLDYGVFFSESYLNMDTRIKDDIDANLRIQQEETKDYSLSIEGRKILYRITILEDNTKFVTVLSDTYLNAFQSALVTSIVNVLLLVCSLLFFLLMVWVTFLIHPINQIRDYLNKIRRKEPATLQLNRQDEIGQIADALVEFNVELEKQEQAKEDLIHNISHDLKTPIAAIKSYAESIKDGVYPYDTLENSVDVIIEHAGRLEDKVYRLLLLNRIGYIVSEKNYVDVNMNEVVRKAVLSLKAVRKDIQISYSASEEGITFIGFEESWRVVVENLLDNALRYAKTKISLRLEKDYLGVENDGPQISKDVQAKLFRPFEKGQGGQSGLGLYIVYRAVQAFQYEIYGENTQGGVIFRIKKKENLRPLRPKRRVIRTKTTGKVKDEAKAAGK